MDDLWTYQIEIRGPVDERDVNATSPLYVVVARADNRSLLAARTDQSGLIGLLRYLHGRGLVLLSMRRCQDGG